MRKIFFGKFGLGSFSQHDFFSAFLSFQWWLCSSHACHVLNAKKHYSSHIDTQKWFYFQILPSLK